MNGPAFQFLFVGCAAVIINCLRKLKVTFLQLINKCDKLFVGDLGQIADLMCKL